MNLEGLGTSPNLRGTTRAFVLRSFFPQGAVFLTVWYRYLEVVLLFPLAALLILRLRRGDFPPLLLLGFSFVVALLPVLPLTIGVVTPESERLVYMATAFSCLFLVFFIDRTIKKPSAVASIVLLFCAGHAVALTRLNQSWREAAEIMQSTLSSFAQTMREHGRVGSPVYVLNVQDNVRGAYIFRRGFHEALRIAAPDQLSTMAQTYVLSVHAITNPEVSVRVLREGPRTLQFDVGGGLMLGAALAPTPAFTIRDWSTQGFAVDFTEAADGSLMLYFTPRSTAVIGRLPLSEPRNAP